MNSYSIHGSVARIVALIFALLVAGMALLPIGGLVLGIATNAAGPAPLSGTAEASFTDVLRQSGVVRLTANSLLLAVAVTSISLGLGTALAWFEQRARYPGGRLLATLCLLPLAMPSFLLAGALREMLGPGGLIGRALGLPVFTGLAPAVVVLTVVCTPYVQVLVGAALLRQSAAEEEAARSLGAGGWRCFASIVLPRLRPALALSGMLVLLYVVSDFGAVAVLDCHVLTWRMYQAYETQNLARAAALGLAALVLILPFLLASLRMQGEPAVVPGAANPRAAGRRRLSPVGVVAAYALHACVAGLGLALPVLVLGQWVRGGLIHGEEFANLRGPLLQTLTLAALGALIVVLLAIAPAWVSSGRAGWRRLLDYAVYLQGALPGILVATGLVIAALSLQRSLGWGAAYVGLRQAGVLLFAGYSMRYLSQGFSGLKSAFLRLDVRQEECARSLGARAWRRWTRVLLPSIAPGAAAAYLLLFLVLVKELPITLVLQPIGVQTLSFRVFDRYREAFLHDAGLAGLTLLVLALGCQLATLRWRRHV